MLQTKLCLLLKELVVTVRDSSVDSFSFIGNEGENKVIPYLKHNVEITERKNGFSNRLTSWPEDFDMKFIAISRPKEYIERLSSSFPILNQCLEEIKVVFQLNYSDALDKLSCLINFLHYRLQTQVNDEEIDALVLLFINDLSGDSKKWGIKIWVQGIWLEEKKMKISNEVTIREPESSDLEIIRPKNTFASNISPNVLQATSAIIEISKIFSNNYDVDEYIEWFVKSLRLYTFSSVEIIKKECVPHSITMRFNSLALSIEMEPHFYQLHTNGIGSNRDYSDINFENRYKINIDESETIKTFTDIVIDFFSKDNTNKENKSYIPIFIALNRYYEALEKKSIAEKKITNIMTAFEALLSDGGEGITHKLSLRVSYLSRFFQHNTIDVYDKVYKLYGIRSDYIHGRKLSETKRNELYESQKMILDLLRKVILIFIELLKTSSKEHLIKDIDKAILDTNANKVLSERISNLELLRLTASNTGFKKIGL